MTQRSSKAEPNTADPALTRRRLLTRGVQLGVAAPSLGWLLAGCGSSESSSTSSTAGGASEAPKGTAVMVNFADWIGKTEVKDFSAQHPGAGVRILVDTSGTPSGLILKVKNNAGAYDLMLADVATVAQAKAAGICQVPDWSKVPNIANVDPDYRKQFPDGMPNDQGKIVLGYRKDLVKEDIASWGDLWRAAPRYSGKIILPDQNRDSLGIALKYLGHSANTKDPGEIDEARQALLQLKPHLRAFTSTDVAQALVKGTVAIAVTYDYNVASAQAESKDVAWLIPDEGTVGYLEGWMLIKQGRHLDVAHSWMNFHLEPKNYASFVEATGSGWVMSKAESLYPKSIRQQTVMQSSPGKVEYEQFLAEATPLWADAWGKVKAGG